MVDWFFYLEKGKARGPLEKEDMLKAFDRGRIGPLDLIYQEGQQQWVPAFEHKEFKSLFKDKPQHSFIERPRKIWVVLHRKKPEEGKGFFQSGPFTQAEVQKKIHRGEISYMDYIWKSGFKKWTRVRDVEEFSQETSLPEVPALYPDEVVDDSITKTPIHEISSDKLFKKSAGEQRPPEAGTPDLTRPWEPELEINIIEDPPSPSTPKAKSNPRIEIQTPVRQQPTQISIETTSDPLVETASQTWLIRALVLAVSLSFVALILVFTSSPNEYRWSRLWRPIAERYFPSDSVEAPVQESQQAGPPATAPVEAAPQQQSLPTTPRKVEVPPRRPERISARLLDGRKLEFSTDGTFHYPIRVRVFGQAGKVYSKSGVYKEALVKWTGAQVPLLDLKSLRLPKGDYVVLFSQDSVQRMQGIRVEDLGGGSLSSFREAKKWQAMDFNSERRDLILVSGTLMDFAEELENSYRNLGGQAQSWSRFYKAWLSKVRLVERNKLRNALSRRQLPWYWHLLREKVDLLQAKALAYDRQVKTNGKAKLAALQTRPSRELSEFHKEVLGLKLF